MSTDSDDKNIDERELEGEELVSDEDSLGADDDLDSSVDDSEDSDQSTVGLTGASELDSLHEELQNYEEDEAVPAARSENQDRGQRDLTTEYLLTDEIKIRAQRDHGKIRVYLTGKILFKLSGTSKSFVFDWTTDQLKTGLTKENEADCIINISEDVLMKVAYGDLNPQVAMLSDKIQVSGKLGLAIYIFNLIAPRNFLH